jgi:SPP1 family predicted phage head-tail adaptor
MAAVGEMRHRLKFAKAGEAVKDGKGGTRPVDPITLGEAWVSAKQIKEDRLLRFSELGIQEAYQFEGYYDARYKDANLVQYEGEWLTVHRITDQDQDRRFMVIVAYGEA